MATTIRPAAPLRKRAVLTGLAIAALALAAIGAPPAAADTYPSRPLRIVHGFAPGGAADTLSRVLAEDLTKRLGQQVIVEARPGAGGNIAADAVSKAPRDGYTIGLVTGAHAISAALYQALPYKPLDSFEMISTVVFYPLVFATRADHPAKTLAEFIALAKARPGALSFGSVGFGSTHHLAGELLKTSARIDVVHVPYRGDAQAITGLLAGDVPMIVGTAVLLAPQIEGGAVRALAVTSSQRIALLPAVPSSTEAGLAGYDVRTWAGVVAPQGTPPAIIARLNQALHASLADPAIKARLEGLVGGEVKGGTPAEMRALVAAEITRWTAVVEEARIPRIGER
jgi:tripartite-type tricarboxylate transporter receptor subunit TctC